MVDYCLMTSVNYRAGIFSQELGLSRASKDFLPLLSTCGSGPDILKPNSLKLGSGHIGDQWKATSLSSDHNESVILDPTLSRPVLVDVQDVRSDSVLFSFGIAEKCARHEKIMQYLMSGSKAGRDVNLSVLSDLMGLHTVAIDMRQLSTYAPTDDFCLYELEDGNPHPSLLYPRSEFYVPKPLLDFVGDAKHGSMLTVHPNGQVLFTGTGAEVKDLISIVSEFSQAKHATKCCQRSFVVPYFTRKGRAAKRASVATVAPVKSPEKIKVKPSKKKQGRKVVQERDLYKKNYFHACESLLSVLSDKRCRKTTMLSLRKSGPELPLLLNQFSAGIAGTGLAVIFSVLCKTVGGRVPFSAIKLLNTGFGFGLVWLSWAVNRLRDTIAHISKNSSISESNEEENIKKVDGNVKEVIFRAAMIMAVAMLRFA